MTRDENEDQRKPFTHQLAVKVDQQLLHPVDREQLVLGQAHTCGVTDTGELYCWGDGRWDQLGAGTEFAPTPVRVLPID